MANREAVEAGMEQWTQMKASIDHHVLERCLAMLVYWWIMFVTMDPYWGFMTENCQHYYLPDYFAFLRSMVHTSVYMSACGCSSWKAHLEQQGKDDVRESRD